MLQGCVRLSVVYDVWTDFNSLAYHIPALSVDYQKHSFFYRTVRDWNCRLSVQYSLNNSGVMLCISVNCIWGTPPFVVKGSRDLPWGASDIHLYINSTTPMHLEPFVMHSALPVYVRSLWSFRSLQLVEVWPYLEERKKICIVAKRCVLQSKSYIDSL